VNARPTEHLTADVLRVLAVSRSSGALEIRGTPSGTIFLHKGEVTYAEALGIPPIQQSSIMDPRLQSTIYSAVVEAGLILLTGPNPDGERPLFRPGREHWTGLTCRLDVETLLVEINQQMHSFKKLGVEPDDEVRLCELPRGRSMVLSRQQWTLVAQLSGAQTARSLAWGSAEPLGATIAAVASLVGAGVARIDPADLTRPERSASAPSVASRVPAAPATHRPPGPTRAVSAPVTSTPVTSAPVTSAPVTPAAATSTPAEPVGSPPPRLPRRVRGSTSVPNPAPDVQPRAIPRKDVPPRNDPNFDTRHAVALRLLEGLRRI
jgi:hypothetical protein